MSQKCRTHCYSPPLHWLVVNVDQQGVAMDLSTSLPIYIPYFTVHLDKWMITTMPAVLDSPGLLCTLHHILERNIVDIQMDRPVLQEIGY